MEVSFRLERFSDRFVLHVPAVALNFLSCEALQNGVHFAHAFSDPLQNILDFGIGVLVLQTESVAFLLSLDLGHELDVDFVDGGLILGHSLEFVPEFVLGLGGLLEIPLQLQHVVLEFFVFELQFVDFLGGVVLGALEQCESLLVGLDYFCSLCFSFGLSQVVLLADVDLPADGQLLPSRLGLIFNECLAGRTVAEGLCLAVFLPGALLLLRRSAWLLEMASRLFPGLIAFPAGGVGLVPGGMEEVALASFAYLVLQFLDGLLLPADGGLQFLDPGGLVHDNECSWIMRQGSEAVVELGAQQVADLDLRDVVDDELVVEQRAAGLLDVLPRAHRHRHVAHLHEVGGTGGGAADALRGVLARGQVGRVVVGLVLLVHLSQRHFAQQQDARAVLAGGEAVVRGLRGHVREVDALPEHVARHRGFRRGDAQSLTQDAHEVGESAPVPQQHLVADVLGEAHVLGLAAEGEEVLEVERVGVVGGAVGGLQVAVDGVELGGVLVDGADVAVEAEVVGVELVLVLAAALEDVGGEFDFCEGLEHFELLLDLEFVVEDEVAHVSEAEVVGDEGVEVVGEFGHHVRPLLAAHLVHQFLQDLVAVHDVVLREVAQRHLAHVVPDLRHLLVHHVQVEDQLDQPLHRARQLALRELLLLLLLHLLLLLLFGRRLPLGLLRVAEFDFAVVAVVVLVVVLGVVEVDGAVDGAGPDVGLLPLDAYPAPTRVEVAVVGVGVALQNLQDVVLVVIVLH